MTRARIVNELPTGSWTVDTAASTAGFVAREKFGQTVAGTIPIRSGTVAVVDGHVVGVDAELSLAGIDTGHRRRDKDLRGKHFFHTDLRPTMRFAAGVAEPTDGGWVLPGVLHVNGRQCAVRLQVRLDATAADPQDGVARVFASATIDRRDAGIKVPSLLIRRPIAIELCATLRLR